MLLWRISLALAAVFAGLHAPAQAHLLADNLAPGQCAAPAAPTGTPAGVPEGPMTELLDCIAAAAAYDLQAMRADPPEIGFCHAGDSIPYESGTALVDDALNGAYDWPNHRIILVRPWDPSDPRDRSVLLHELVHAVQLANRTYACLEQPEWEA
jgi:hypothetical protein